METRILTVICDFSFARCESTLSLGHADHFAAYLRALTSYIILSVVVEG